MKTPWYEVKERVQTLHFPGEMDSGTETLWRDLRVKKYGKFIYTIR